jgi:hypothetical protein
LQPLNFSRALGDKGRVVYANPYALGTAFDTF